MPDEEPEEGAEDEPTGSAGLDHDENLAEHIPEDALRKIASELDAEIQMDIAARSDWETTYKEGVKLLGLKMEDRTEPWEGACGVVHPMITEAVVRFQAEMVTETFPAGGPVRTKILGKETPLKKQAAAFCRCVDEGAEPIVSGAAGLAAVRCAEKIVEAIQAHRWDGEGSDRHGPGIISKDS